jgi:hypothetical protein
VRKREAAKTPRAFGEWLTDPVCYAAKWLKSRFEDLVPGDNFYRRLEEAFDLCFVRELVRPLYANPVPKASSSRVKGMLMTSMLPPTSSMPVGLRSLRDVSWTSSTSPCPRLREGKLSQDRDHAEIRARVRRVWHDGLLMDMLREEFEDWSKS